MAQLVALEPRKPQNSKGVFDAHHPPSQELMDDCVHCGFCLPTCPTYLLWHEEMDSPRGRIYLMRMGAEGGVAEMDGTFVDHFDQCLGCMACMTACPSGVQYSPLIEATRAQIERNYKRPFWERVYRRLIFEIFPHPRRLRLALLPLWFYQKSGLRWLLRKSGLLRLLPEQLRSMEALLPELSLSALYKATPVQVAARGTKRRRVGVLLGCVQRVMFSDANLATIRVLSKLGCEVVVPPEQGCCGALMTHTGREAEAQAAARKLIETFERADVDTVVINAAGCGSNMKDYPNLFRDNAEWLERARKFSGKCRDVTEVIAELGLEGAEFEPINMIVAYHDPCHLLHAQGVQRQPRELLNAIPGLKLKELPESQICCGSAGVYNLVEPAPAKQLADRKAQNIIRSGAEALVSANPGCLLQISSALQRAERSMPAMHIVEMLDRAMK
ncbi:MAG TPA: (Fe-S)-binding protein [candidate division Zixibacteria bacterium]|nr:(Fe-S)-binding protein [candidate division Zixibacteria bacterium]